MPCRLIRFGLLRHRTILCTLGMAASSLAAQAPAASRDTVLINRSTNPLLASFKFRSIGPATMGGRVDDVEIAPSNGSIVYIGYATGGVFKSENNGTSFDLVDTRETTWDGKPVQLSIGSHNKSLSPRELKAAWEKEQREEREREQRDQRPNNN